MGMRTVLNESYERGMDYVTGEVKEEIRRGSYRYETEPGYIKLYLEDLLKLTSGMKSYTKVLLYLMKHCSFASDEQAQCVQLSTGVKKMMMQELGYKSLQVIDNCLLGLKRAGIIMGVAEGLYMLNPKYFGRGDWRDISKLRMTIDYDNTGKMINTFVSYNGGKKE